jgi:hypothetical protein
MIHDRKIRRRSYTIIRRFSGREKQGAPYTKGGSGTSLVPFTPEKTLDTLRSTPSGEDPILWPIRVLNECN